MMWSVWADEIELDFDELRLIVRKMFEDGVDVPIEDLFGAYWDVC